MSVGWDTFKKFERVTDMYMPARGEGETKASQLVTAVNKLVYKWYNDGDVYDTTGILEGWANDLSSYANWIYKYIPRSRNILDGIFDCYNGDEYEDLLLELAEATMDDEDVENLAKEPKEGSIYECDGPFEFNYDYGDDDEEDWYEDSEYEEEETWDEGDIESSVDITAAEGEDVLQDTLRTLKDDFEYILSGIEKLDRSSAEDSRMGLEIAEKLSAQMQEIISDISDRF